MGQSGATTEIPAESSRTQDRSTLPDALMNMLLRFETPQGPRTVVAASVPLAIASDIHAAMRRMGQHAEFIDRCPPLSITERVKIKRAEKARHAKRDFGNVVALGKKKRAEKTVGALDNGAERKPALPAQLVASISR